MARSTAQRQREYRRRLKLRSPELLRERERRKWRRRQMRRKLASQYSTLENTVEARPRVTGMKRQDICNGNMLKDVVSEKSAINEVNSAKYPIHGLLKWLENIEVGDDVKYGFLKYIYSGKSTAYNKGIDECNSGAAEGERQDLRKRRDTPNQVQLHYVNDRKHIPIESSSENVERKVSPHRRKSVKKATKGKNMDVKQRKHITREPLCLDIDDTGANDE